MFRLKPLEKSERKTSITELSESISSKNVKSIQQLNYSQVTQEVNDVITFSVYITPQTEKVTKHKF